MDYDIQHIYFVQELYQTSGWHTNGCETSIQLSCFTHSKLPYSIYRWEVWMRELRGLFLYGTIISIWSKKSSVKITYFFFKTMKIALSLSLILSLCWKRRNLSFFAPFSLSSIFCFSYMVFRIHYLDSMNSSSLNERSTVRTRQ